jgi:hypothetical protein
MTEQSTEKEKGLFMKYFVLKPGDYDVYGIASRRAMLEYANAIEAFNPDFARDIRAWVNDIEK